MRKHIVCIASEHKGNEFLEECSNNDWDVSLITRRKLLDEPWSWPSITNVATVPDDAGIDDYVRAAANLAGAHKIDRIVGLDEFDIMSAAKAREHLQMPGPTCSYLLRFRDKLEMRNLAAKAGLPCPGYIPAFNSDDIAAFLEKMPGPWIVKPRNEVSAFGIRKCETADDVWQNLHQLDGRNTWRDHPSQFLIEQFVAGSVYHVDSVVDGGRVLASGVSKYGTPPFAVSHYGGVFTSSIISYRSKERKTLEKLNEQLLSAFQFEKGVTHAEFLQSAADGKFYLLEVACRVGGAYIANVLEHACGFNLWREWARLEMSSKSAPYKLPKTTKAFAGVALSLANTDRPDTSIYQEQEIVYRVSKPKHVGLIFRSTKEKRVLDLLETYSRRIVEDFLATAPAKERYDD